MSGNEKSNGRTQLSLAPTLEEIEEKVGAMSEGSRSIFKGDDSKPQSREEVGALES